MGRSKINRINELSYNKQKLMMKIIKYNGNNDIDVEFDNGWIAKNRNYYEFKNGSIKNPFYPSVCGIGFLGEGKYNASFNGKHTKEYVLWKNMLKRCYDNKYQEKLPTYKECTVCKEWYNFQNFAKWFYNNYYEVESERMELDKDILVKGNKIYSPETCVFVPQNINKLFTKRQNDRGNLPIGLKYNKKLKIQVSCDIGNNKRKHLGYYNTIEEAFMVYKEFKESYIRQVADEYKNKIPEKLYNALYSYKVEFDD